MFKSATEDVATWIIILCNKIISIWNITYEWRNSWIINVYMCICYERSRTMPWDHAMKVIYEIPSMLHYWFLSDLWSAGGPPSSRRCAARSGWLHSRLDHCLIYLPHLLWDLYLCSDLALFEIDLVLIIVSGQEETWWSDGGVMDEKIIDHLSRFPVCLPMSLMSKCSMSILGYHLDVILHADVQNISLCWRQSLRSRCMLNDGV